MTSIIATIGPSSDSEEVIKYFFDNGVKIVRLKSVYNSLDWHVSTAKLCQKIGLKVLVDLAGPKFLIGSLQEAVSLRSGDLFIFEYEKDGLVYPYLEGQMQVLPSQSDLATFLNPGDTILMGDGEREFVVQKVGAGRVFCKVIFGGMVESRKGLHFPGVTIDQSFLTQTDKTFLKEFLSKSEPEYIAASFVKSAQDLVLLKDYLSRLGSKTLPKICAKIETRELMEDSKNLESVIKTADLVMIARGDLALETEPRYLAVPFHQERIKQECLKQEKPFIIATQMLATMAKSPIPTRAEVSDLYRAVVLDKADYILFTNETAIGDFPKRCIDLAKGMIKLADAK